MGKFIVSKQNCTGERLGLIEAKDIGAAATEAARTLLLPSAFQRKAELVTAGRVTGDPGKSGCFRVSTPGARTAPRASGRTGRSFT